MKYKKFFWFFSCLLCLYLVFAFYFKKEDAWVPKFINFNIDRNICDSFYKKNFQDIDVSMIQGGASALYCIDDNNKIIELLSVNNDVKKGIASITKIMTAIVLLEDFPNIKSIKFDVDDIGPATLGRYKVGDELNIENSVASLLIESDNDLARAISSSWREVDFIYRMNEKAKKIGMKDTFFRNSSGLDIESGPGNISTPYDLALMIKYFKDHYNKYFKYTTLASFNIKDIKNKFHHTAHSTNLVVSDFYFGRNLIGGKTGKTLATKTNLVAMFKGENDAVFISVVLDSPDHFEDTKKIMGLVLR
jgi:D-alanyl-D-alanine carboxypeptidase